MGKKYKGMTCVYCDEHISVTADHIFAREFFLESKRTNLPQVPACDGCNNEKSKLEHYLTALLPFGGNHEKAKENLATMVPKRLARNKKLHGKLRQGMIQFENGKSKDMLLPMKGDAVTDLFSYIAKGTTWFHWKTIIARDSYVKSMVLTETGLEYFRYLLSLQSRNQIQNDVGDSTFSYVGTQATDPDQMTVWVFRIYGGLSMKSKEFPKAVANCIGVITGPSEIEKDVEEILKGRYKWEK